jgi:hypothetical protein
MKLDAHSIDIRMAAVAPWPDVVPSVEPGLSTLAFLLAVTAATLGSLTGMACGHLDGTTAEGQGIGEFEHGGAQDSECVIMREGAATAADVLRDDADDASGDLVAAPDEGGVAASWRALSRRSTSQVLRRSSCRMTVGIDAHEAGR